MTKLNHRWIILSLVLCAGCGGSDSERRIIQPTDGRDPNARPSTESTPAAQPESAPQEPPVDTRDAPEISRSRGQKGGFVVLWPRIVLPRGEAPDASLRQLAGRVQKRLAEVTAQAAPGRALDLRPEPERVCHRSGCEAASVGALLTRAGKGCAVVALVSGPGTSPATLVPWAGSLRLSSPEVAFRSPPESVLGVKDYVPCDALDTALAAHDAQVKAQIARQAQ